MKKAMYAFSGDPITYGHIDMVQRASNAFDHVVVGIGVNPGKNYMFSLEERTDMAQRSLASFSNVEVVSFSGLLVDYAFENEIGVIVKGIRNAADFDYEKVLHEAGRSQKVGVDTHLLFSDSNLTHVSSSIVKGIQKEHGDIHEYVPLYVKQCLEARMSGQYIVGITGEIGAGKSYTGQRFVELGQQRGLEVHNIELDHIGHQILHDLTEPRYQTVRRQIAETFGDSVLQADGSIDRKVLGEIVFNEEGAADKLRDIMETPIIVRLRKELQGKKGLLLVNAALIAEYDLGHLSNNNVVMVYTDKETQSNRLDGRGLTPQQMDRRLGSQFDFKTKKSRLEAAIADANHGQIWELNNSKDSNDMEDVFEDVISTFGLKGS